MTCDENQTFVAETFSALYQDSRKRLKIAKAELIQRSELCEDLANLMTDHCSTVHFRDGVDTGQVLERSLHGLLTPASGVTTCRGVVGDASYRGTAWLGLAGPSGIRRIRWGIRRRVGGAAPKVKCHRKRTPTGASSSSLALCP